MFYFSNSTVFQNFQVRLNSFIFIVTSIILLSNFVEIDEGLLKMLEGI
jgi:hypothetical protein